MKILLDTHILIWFHTKDSELSENAPRPHKDPFDKILICQAKTENMRLMTHDSLLPFYNEPCILCVWRQLTAAVPYSA
ncbi:MAG: hypothetical protein IKA80_09205 [Spirochaetaceae bacterium]|nr:hypothetical protein [Spirochaetaceae bacterium]